MARNFLDVRLTKNYAHNRLHPYLFDYQLLMLRRLLITWLIVSILGYGMALAADVHNEPATNQTYTVDDHAENPSDTDHANSCDHCCHGVSHLLGLSCANPISLAADRSLLRTPYAVSLISFPPPSILRPPITV